MGYTTRPAPDLVGLGVSAIGDVAGAFAQNTKKLSVYYTAIEAGRFPVERGYALDADDVLRRHVISQLMCNLRLDTAATARAFDVDFDAYFAREREELAEGPMAHGFLRDEAGVLRGDASGPPVRPQHLHDLRPAPAREARGDAGLFEDRLIHASHHRVRQSSGRDGATCRRPRLRRASRRRPALQHGWTGHAR